jgi:hypothetical protein
MPNYIVQWKYQSGLGGPWEGGETVGLDDSRAEVINRDSPGVLVLAEQLDDLTQVAGIGQFEAEGLRALGLTTFEKLAAADPKALAEQLNRMGVFAPRELPEGLAPDNEAAVQTWRTGIVQEWQAQLEALTKARQDRMVRKSQRRERGKGDAITRENFKAVKDK